MAVTTSDVEDWGAKGWNALDSTKKQNLLDRAERFVSDLYDGRVATLTVVDGNKDDMVTLVAAHFWELAEGGEAQSESATGGSVNYNTVTGEIPNGLSETRYGRMALEYVRDDSGIGFITS